MSFVACALGGYAVLMVLAQVRLIPVYRRLSFTPGAWSFAFAYAAAAADALVWLAIKKPPASSGYAIAVIAPLTAFVSWIAFRTLVLAVRGQFFPARLPGTDARNSSAGAAGLLGDAANRAETVMAEGPNAFALPLVPRSVGWALLASA